MWRGNNAIPVAINFLKSSQSAIGWLICTAATVRYKTESNTKNSNHRRWQLLSQSPPMIPSWVVDNQRYKNNRRYCKLYLARTKRVVYSHRRNMEWLPRHHHIPIVNQTYSRSNLFEPIRIAAKRFLYGIWIIIKLHCSFTGPESVLLSDLPELKHANYRITRLPRCVSGRAIATCIKNNAAKIINWMPDFIETLSIR